MDKVEAGFHGSTISFETNRIAKQADGSVLVQYADSIVLVTACLGEEKNAGFLPLTIDYVEKTYSAGKIPGGFFKREGRLSEYETLTSRLIDRPLRPLFPDGFQNEVQVVATVVSSDPEVDTDILALCGASTALTLSSIPFAGPVAGVRVCRINGNLEINPKPEDRKDADLDFIVAGTQDAITMVEGGADQVPEKEVLDALFFAHDELQKIIKLQLDLQAKCGKEKVEFTAPERDAEIQKQVSEFVSEPIKEALSIKDKIARYKRLKEIKTEAKEKFVTEDLTDPDAVATEVSATCSDVVYETLRGLVANESVRIDGRDFKTVRDIDIELGLLPRSHGSSLFTRGETQAIVAVTLGVKEDAQIIDALHEESLKSFFLHYNFPPFSVGETRPLRGPGRREIGHGALAERALRYIMPKQSEFPYVIRIVSEITESNGSSSMATVCGGSLALMNAGVPIAEPVAGVAMGLIKEGDKFMVLTDILGDEDHLGDMDFKVCGTKKGITALQMDIKIAGLDKEIMSQALEQALEGRMFILGEMDRVIEKPAEDVSLFAPRIVTFKINTNKVRDLIGPGGKVIKSICESHSVKINVEDDGTVNISGTDKKSLDAAVKLAKSLTAEAEVGKMYDGVVKRITDFGAFIEILPGTDGLLHISQISEERVNDVNDVFNEGDQVTVKVLDVDKQGRVKLSCLGMSD